MGKPYVTNLVMPHIAAKNATEIACGRMPQNKGVGLFVIAILLGIITALVVVARLAFHLLVSRKSLKSDDWAILVALLTGIPGTIIVVVGTIPNGLGQDTWALTFEQIDRFSMWFLATEVQYFITVPSTKLSLLLFFLRIFPGETVRKLLLATVVFDILYGASFVLVALLQCKPLEYFWTNWDGEHMGSCVNVNAIGWTHAIISIVLDVWMLALPLSQLIGLHMQWKKKAGVVLMFIVGTL